VKKIFFLVLVLMAGSVIAALPIPQTRFRKAPLDLVEQFAAKNDSEAQLELALRYYAGHQVDADAHQAFALMSQSAEQKNPDALHLLSLMVAEGIGVSADLQKAESLFIAALVANPTDAQLQRRFEQLVEEKKNEAGADDAFLKECSDAGYAPATLSLYAPVAASLHADGNYEEALPLLRELSNLGDVGSTLRLAQIVAEGLGGLPKDATLARTLYQQVAKNGDARAQYELAVMYDKGVGGDADPNQAESLYKLSADQGNAAAKSRLAEIEFARFPYVLRPLKDVYPKSTARQKIMLVKENSGIYQNIAGEDAPGLLVKYERPSTSQAAGFSGIILVGVELENRRTGERYWLSGEYLDDGPTYEYACASELDLFVDQEFDSNAEIIGWAVVYGHLLDDGRTVAVFDTREYKADSLAGLFERNRYTNVLQSKVVARTLPQTDMGGDLSDSEGDDEGGRGVLGTIGHVLDILYPLN
jgi:TPR repeat protein